MYILVRNEDGKYVAPSGHGHSYVTKLENAQLFYTIESAKNCACGNERVVKLEDLFECRPI